MEFFKIRRTIPFMRYALIFNIISLLTFVAAVYFLATKGLHFSIEFTGGTQMQLQYPAAPDLEDIRSRLAKGGYPDNQVQTFGKSSELLIRIPLKEGKQSSNVADDAMCKLASPTFSGRIEDKTEASLTRLDIVYPHDKPPQEVRAVVDRAGLDKGTASVAPGGSPRTYVIQVRQQENPKLTPQAVA